MVIQCDKRSQFLVGRGTMHRVISPYSVTGDDHSRLQCGKEDGTDVHMILRISFIRLVSAACMLLR